MIRNFKYYLDNNLVRKTDINPSLVQSLFSKAEVRLQRVIKDKIIEKESSIIFEDIYESIREAIQALIQIKGFKPYSHEVLVSFLNEEKLFSQKIINDFNRFRILRNKSVYEAEKISIETCEEALRFARDFLPKIREKLKGYK